MDKKMPNDYDEEKSVQRLGLGILIVAIIMMTVLIVVLMTTSSVHAQTKNDFALPTQKQVDAARNTMVMPSDQAFQDHMKKRGNSDSEALDKAAAQYGAGIKPFSMPNVGTGREKGTVDPARIAQMYLDANKLAVNSDNPEVMIFVSLSMPPAALERIGKQAKKAGAVVFFRGLKYSLMDPKGWAKSIKALEPISATGADVQIHPELFTRFNVTAVPTVVVSSNSKEGCQDDACASFAASVAGDVSLDYALAQLEDRKDAVGEIARMTNQKLRNSK